MKITIQVTVSHEDETRTSTVTDFQRGQLQADTLGLTLAEAKDVLKQLQQILVSHQIDCHNQQQHCCPDCYQMRAKKDTKFLSYRTLFGKLSLESPRYYTCACQAREKKSESPLSHVLTERSSPELLYLQTKWASLMSYGMTTDLLNDVLPIDVCDSSVRHQVQSVAQRSEDELGSEQAMFIEGSPHQWEQNGNNSLNLMPASSLGLMVDISMLEREKIVKQDGLKLLSARACQKTLPVNPLDS